MNNTRRIKAFIVAMVLAAAGLAGYASSGSHRVHAYLGLAVLALAAATSRMKVKLPGINGNMSVNLPFLLTAALNLSAAEAVLIAAASTLVQCWPRKHAKFNWQQIIFNVSMMSFATAIATLLANARWWGNSASLLFASTALFLAQTTSVAAIVAMSENKSAAKLWKELAQLSFPYYVLSAGVTSMVQASGSRLGWGLTLAVFPVMYVIHRCYRLYFGRMMENVQNGVLVRAAGAGA